MHCFPASPDTDGLISQALLVGNFDGAVELCVRADRFADAIILAIAGGEKLLRETQRRYFAKQKTKISQVRAQLCVSRERWGMWGRRESRRRCRVPGQVCIYTCGCKCPCECVGKGRNAELRVLSI